MARLSLCNILIAFIAVIASILVYIYFIKHQPHAALLSAIKHKDHYMFTQQLNHAINEYKNENHAQNQFHIDMIDFGDGRSLAHAVAMHGSDAQLETLIQYGSTLDLQSNDGRTPLHVAAIYNEPSFVAKLINAAYSFVDVQAQHDWTPLLFAVLFSRLENARILLENGANPNACVKGGLCAVQLSVVYSSNDMTDMLIEHGAVLQPDQTYYDDWHRRLNRVHAARETSKTLPPLSELS